MGFLLFLILILGFIFWPVIRAALTMRRARNAFREMFDAAAGNGAGKRRPEEPQKPQHRKIFGSDEGEYVEFEEITEVSATVEEESGPGGSYTRTEITEQQVTDVEWEDIK